jgi:hypothetical protein
MISPYSQRKEIEDPRGKFNEDLAKKHAKEEGLSLDEWVKKEQKEIAHLKQLSEYEAVDSIEKIPPIAQKRIRAELNI